MLGASTSAILMPWSVRVRVACSRLVEARVRGGRGRNSRGATARATPCCRCHAEDERTTNTLPHHRAPKSRTAPSSFISSSSVSHVCSVCSVLPARHPSSTHWWRGARRCLRNSRSQREISQPSPECSWARSPQKTRRCLMSTTSESSGRPRDRGHPEALIGANRRDSWYGVTLCRRVPVACTVWYGVSPWGEREREGKRC